nr:cobyrinate a,c-diamide synthase [uncultured Mediterraneibacter sp.]
MQIPRILIAAPASGSGKTAVSCALMYALREQGLSVHACKCGPDYIDPMFHREVLELDSRNLDLFFSGPEELREEFIRHASGADITVTEGVMGYYDGRSIDSDAGSSYDVARTLNMPVILVISSRGAALSLAAIVKGIAAFRKDSNICGLLLNRVSKMLYPRLKEMLSQELEKCGCSIPIAGYIPEDEAFHLESRHLGLVTPQERKGLNDQIRQAGRILSETVELDIIREIARSAPELNATAESEKEEVDCSGKKKYSKNPVRIGIAQDEAFCFYYKANLELLESMGCELVPFSPIKDEKLPGNIGGLILGGGYPELYAGRLSANRSLTEEIGERLKEKMPCYAECGGFMYLHETMEDEKGNVYPMVGEVKGSAYPAGRLVRFGYVNIKAATEQNGYLRPGEMIRGHEFHYWDSTDSGRNCVAEKPDGRRRWECVHMTKDLFAGYPHLYLPSMPEFARRFVSRCRTWKQGAEESKNV